MKKVLYVSVLLLTISLVAPAAMRPQSNSSSQILLAAKSRTQNVTNNSQQENVAAVRDRRSNSGDDFNSYYNQGVRLALAGRNEEAIAAFKRALQLNPSHHDAHFSLANVYLNMQRWREAAEEYKQVIRLNRKDGEAYNNLGVAYLNLNLLEDAVRAFEQAIRIFPNWAEPHFNLGTANSKLGLNGAALAAYKRAMQLRPDYANRVPQSAGGKASTETAAAAQTLNASARNNNTAPPPPRPTPSPSTAEPATRRAATPSASSAIPAATNGVTSSSPPANNASTNTPNARAALPRTTPGTETAAATTTTANAPTTNAAPNTNNTVAPSTNGGGGASNAANASSTTASATVDPTNIYRVGAGDVLDIRLLNAPTNQSTLYTVQAGGVLEYPLVGNPIVVAGMTTDEIDARITSELQRRAIQADPQVVVSVREYESHRVIISGLVANPGNKILQREAIPLYVVIADAQPRPEAAQAVVNSHLTGQTTTVDLSDPVAMNMLIRSGDVINVTTQTPQFYYIGGDIETPGQKQFHSGITLTQAILASGGFLRAGKTIIEIARQGADGRLNVVRYNLADIMSGKTPDPRLQAGDRVEVYR